MRIKKILSATDIGASNTHQSGILVPKNARILSFFPQLDVSKKNPDCLIHLHLPQVGSQITARYIFYNTRDLGLGTRSEYRLTRIASSLHELLPEVGDELVFDSSGGDIEMYLERAESTDLGDYVTLNNGWKVSVA